MKQILVSIDTVIRSNMATLRDSEADIFERQPSGQSDVIARVFAYSDWVRRLCLSMIDDKQHD